jgi:hypothetical protein
MEELDEKKKADNTSLGLIQPKVVHDLIVTPEDQDWKPQFKAAMLQARLWDDRTASKEPPRKVPFRFQYRFDCDGERCNGHTMTIEDWEVGALYWNLIDRGATPDEAAAKVKTKFLKELCGPEKDTRFFVGTVLAHGTWVVIGVFYPKKADGLPLFEQGAGQ